MAAPMEFPANAPGAPVSENAPPAPELTIGPDGKITTAKQPEPEAKKNIRIVQNPPSERLRQAREKVLLAMVAEPKVTLGTPAADTNITLDGSAAPGRGAGDGREPGFSYVGRAGFHSAAA